MRQDRRSERVLSDAERARLRELRDSIVAEKDDILAEGRRHKAAHDDAAARLRDVASIFGANFRLRRTSA